MSFYVDDEIASQPDCWDRALTLTPTVIDQFPRAGERVAFVGCGTSWFVAQVLAHWRESQGFGESDAFTASEFLDRPYDTVVALTRSGTTSEVVDLLTRLRGRIPTVAVLGAIDTPAAAVADTFVDLSFADEQSVVQTRFATTTLTLFRSLLFGRDEVAPLVERARAAVSVELPAGLAEAEQLTFLGQGWTVGLAHEAALKLRETSGSWAESYPAMDYRHGPIAVAAPGRVVWMFGDAPAGLADQVRATGAIFVDHDQDAVVDLIVAQRVAVARAARLGLDPDQPRHLSRSVVLSS